jgi:hypothetical protein
MRTRTLLLSAIAMTVVPVWLGGLAAGGSPPGRAGFTPETAAPPSDTIRALAVLRDWDRRRAAAWRRGDPVALGRLYTAGSRTGRRDEADLERWRHRGFRVVGLRQQVSAAHLAADGRRRLILVVTDRTVDGIAVGAGRRTSVPQSDWATHRISLRHTRAGWQVMEATLSASGRAPSR